MWFEVTADPAQIARERNKARELRKSQWWHQKVSRGRCEHCEGRFPPGELTMDHLVPLARGGISSKSNIVVACRPCNQSKKLATPVDLILAQLEGPVSAENQDGVSPSVGQPTKGQ